MVVEAFSRQYPLRIPSLSRPASSAGLPELIELFLINAELVQNSIKEWRTNFPPTVDRDGRGAPVLMPPSFVAPGLARLHEAELRRGSTEFLSAGARHAQSR